MKKLLYIFLFSVCVSLFLLGMVACSGTISVSGICFIQNDIELYIGDEYQLAYTISPDNASNSNVMFTSSDKSIVTVDDDGVVFAISQGEAEVTVITEDGNYSGVCIVTVIASAVIDNQDEMEITEEEQKDETEDQEETDDSEQSDNTEGSDKQTSDEEATTYKVTFMAGEEVIDECTFTEDNITIEEPNVPVKDGYYVEWESYALILDDIIVNAVFIPIEYEITFIANDSTVDVISFTVETISIGEPSVPSKSGYEGTWESYVLGCKNITVYAVYTVCNYTIIYANTKGADNVNQESYSVDNVFPLEDLSVKGYTFDGWYIDDERVYSVNGRYGDLTITAKWSLVDYEIRFIDENYNIIATEYYNVENSDIALPDVPVKVGYYVVWDSFELTYDTEPVRVYAIYTKIEE